MHQINSAHSISLPLFSLMQKADESETVAEAAQKLSRGIDEMKLDQHVQPVIEFDEDREILSVRPKDDFGKSICQELMERFSDPPCPEGMCEIVMDVMRGTVCRWCGREPRN